MFVGEGQNLLTFAAVNVVTVVRISVHCTLCQKYLKSPQSVSLWQHLLSKHPKGEEVKAASLACKAELKKTRTHSARTPAASEEEDFTCTWFVVRTH